MKFLLVYCLCFSYFVELHVTSRYIQNEKKKIVLICGYDDTENFKYENKNYVSQKYGFF